MNACEWCGGPLHKGKRFCSRQCNQASISVPAAERNVYRYGPRWDAIARAIKDRDKWTCQDCGDYQRLGPPWRSVKIEVHHIVPVDDFNRDWPRANHPDNLISLCTRCHSRRERGLHQEARP